MPLKTETKMMIIISSQLTERENKNIIVWVPMSSPKNPGLFVSINKISAQKRKNDNTNTDDTKLKTITLHFL